MDAMIDLIDFLLIKVRKMMSRMDFAVPKTIEGSTNYSRSKFS